MNRRRFLQLLSSVPVAGSMPVTDFSGATSVTQEKTAASVSEWFTLPADHLPQSLRDNFIAVRESAEVLQRLQKELGSFIKLKSLINEQDGLESGTDALGYWQLDYPRIMDAQTKEDFLQPRAVAQTVRQSIKERFTDSVRFIPMFNEDGYETIDRCIDIVVADYGATENDLALLDTCCGDQEAMKSFVSELDYRPDHLVPLVKFHFKPLS